MLKPKVKEVYEYIKNRISEGFSPSIREIQEAMGYKSTSTAFRYVETLIEMGLIEKSNNLNRSIRLPNFNAISVPLIGTVTAGIPITAIESIEGYVSFDSDKKFYNDLFALKIRGESMIEAGILDGDVVIVEKTSYAENGDIVVAFIDNEEATVKRFYKENGHFRLQPENPSMEPIILNQVSILGKIVGLKRYY